MSKLLRTTLISLAALVALIAALVVGLLLLLDPAKYRSSIEQAVLDATGLELTIAGDLDMMFQPYVGITLTDVRLKNPSRPQELASSSAVTLRVEPRELLSGRLLVYELRADDLHINWYVDADGNAWWMTDQVAGTGTGDLSGLQAGLEFVEATNASVDIQNLQRRYSYSLRNLNLSSQNSNVAGRPFPLQASFELIGSAAPKPWPVTLATRTALDLGTGNVDVTDIQLALTPALVEGQVLIRDLFGATSWESQLSTSEFALDDLLDNLFATAGSDPEPSLPGFNTDPRWQTQAQVRISGDSSGIELPSLTANLGDMGLTVDGNLRYGNGLLPTNARFNIATSALNLAPYLEIEEGPGAPAASGSNGLPAASGTGTDEDDNGLFALRIPDRLRSGVNIQGSLSVDSLFVAGLQFGQVTLFSNLESGVLDVELQPTAVLDGSLEGNLRLNSVPARSEVTLEIFGSDISLADLNLPLVAPGSFSGRLNQQSRYQGTGATVGEWLESFSGATTFYVTGGSADIGIVKQVFTSITVLSPSGEAIQQWPDVISVNDFSGYVLFEDGLDDAQEVKLQLDNIDITGTGGVDLPGQQFDYELLFTVLSQPFSQTIPVNELYHNVSWPVRCEAAFTDPVNRYCRPDLAQVREIFNQLESGTLPDRLEQILPVGPPQPEQDQDQEQNSVPGLPQDLTPVQNIR